MVWHRFLNNGKFICEGNIPKGSNLLKILGFVRQYFVLDCRSLLFAMFGCEAKVRLIKKSTTGDY